MMGGKHMSTIKEQFDITGMSCAACSAHVEKSVRKLSGIDDVKVNLLENSMVAVHDESVTANDIINAVKSGGYGASLHGAEKSAVNGEDSETDVMKKRLIYSVCFLIPLMYVSMGHMINAPFTGFFMQNEYLAVYALTQLLLTLPVIFINFKFFRSGTKAVLHGAPNMDTLVASGSAAALIYGIYSLYCICIFSGKGDFHTAHGYAMNLYFESSAMILTLITVGKYLEARAKKHTSDAVSALMKLAPQEAHVIRDGKELTVSAEELITGDEIIVKTGESIPCDGTVTGGSGLVDESAVTGESIPVTKESGDKLTGATILKSGYLTFRAEAVGKDTMFAKIIELVRSAAADKAPVARIADKVCGVFVPAVMLIALVTFIVWLILGKTVHPGLSILLPIHLYFPGESHEGMDVLVSFACHIVLERLTVLDRRLTGRGDDHSLCVPTKFRHDSRAEMFDDYFDTLGDVGFVQIHEPGDLALGFVGLIQRVSFNLLVQAVICIIRDIVLQHIQNEAFLYGLLHGVIFPALDYNRYWYKSSQNNYTKQKRTPPGFYA